MHSDYMLSWALDLLSDLLFYLLLITRHFPLCSTSLFCCAYELRCAVPSDLTNKSFGTRWKQLDQICIQLKIKCQPV